MLFSGNRVNGLSVSKHKRNYLKVCVTLRWFSSLIGYFWVCCNTVQMKSDLTPRRRKISIKSDLIFKFSIILNILNWWKSQIKFNLLAVEWLEVVKRISPGLLSSSLKSSRGASKVPRGNWSGLDFPIYETKQNNITISMQYIKKKHIINLRFT